MGTSKTKFWLLLEILCLFDEIDLKYFIKCMFILYWHIDIANSYFGKILTVNIFNGLWIYIYFYISTFLVYFTEKKLKNTTEKRLF